MKAQTLIRLDLDYHLFHLDHLGFMTQSIHRYSEPSLYQKIMSDEHIKDYSVVYKENTIHLLAITKTGIYYVKFPINNRKKELLKFRISTQVNVSHPYLFFYKSALYVCYVEHEENHCRLMIKSYTSEMWISQVLLEDKVNDFQINDVAFSVGLNGQFYVLCQYINRLEESILKYVKYDLEQGIVSVNQLFVEKTSDRKWSIGIGIDPNNRIHFAWTISNSVESKAYYTNINQSFITPIPLDFYDKKLLIPYFLFLSNGMILSIWNGAQTIRSFYSSEGQPWKTCQELCFYEQTSLFLIQVVDGHQNKVISPIPKIGMGLPFFRPIEYIDIINPYTTLLTPSPLSLEMMEWIKHQMDHLHLYMYDQTHRLQQEISAALLQNNQYQKNITNLMYQYEQLDKEEQDIRNRINDLRRINAESKLESMSE